MIDDRDIDELWGELALPAVKAAHRYREKKKTPTPQMQQQRPHEDEPEQIT